MKFFARNEIYIKAALKWVIDVSLTQDGVMGKQAFVKAYVCFQTTASPRPFDYEYKNIRLLP